MKKKHRKLRDLGLPTDRWSKRPTPDGFEGCGVLFYHWVEGGHVLGPPFVADTLQEFLRGVEHLDSTTPMKEYPARPIISGKPRANLDTRLRALWSLLGAENRIDAMTPHLRPMAPVWRYRAIAILPLTEGEKKTLRGRWRTPL